MAYAYAMILMFQCNKFEPLSIAHRKGNIMLQCLHRMLINVAPACRKMHDRHHACPHDESSCTDMHFLYYILVKFILTFFYLNAQFIKM